MNIYFGLSVIGAFLPFGVDVLPTAAGIELSRGQISDSISAMH